MTFWIAPCWPLQALSHLVLTDVLPVSVNWSNSSSGSFGASFSCFLGFAEVSWNTSGEFRCIHITIWKRDINSNLLVLFLSKVEEFRSELYFSFFCQRGQERCADICIWLPTAIWLVLMGSSCQGNWVHYLDPFRSKKWRWGLVYCQIFIYLFIFCGVCGCQHVMIHEHDCKRNSFCVAYGK